MPRSRQLKHIFHDFTVQLSKSEYNVLNELVDIEKGNAYSIWKKTHLKHYPTVLRSLKKLKEKGFVELLRQRGERNEKLYAPTLIGKLVLPFLINDEKTLLAILAQESTRFRDLLHLKIDHESCAHGVIHDLISGPKAKNKNRQRIDSIVQASIQDELRDCAANIHLESDRKMLIELAKLEWIEELAIQEINLEITSSQKRLHTLLQFRKKFTA